MQICFFAHREIPMGEKSVSNLIHDVTFLTSLFAVTVN
jgi:hypothetical protein